jgi:hypothetical protein
MKALVKTGVSVQEIGRSLGKITNVKARPRRGHRLVHA